MSCHEGECTNTRNTFENSNFREKPLDQTECAPIVPDMDKSDCDEQIFDQCQCTATEKTLEKTQCEVQHQQVTCKPQDFNEAEYKPASTEVQLVKEDRKGPEPDQSSRPSVTDTMELVKEGKGPEPDQSCGSIVTVTDAIFDQTKCKEFEEMECKRKGLCGVCEKNLAKYRCPKCLLRTCSLACVKAHKESTNCDGVRCKTAFVPMKAYNANHMLSDYRLLEEIGRSCDNNDRDWRQRLSTTSKWTLIQTNQARRRNINLKLAPLQFTMHKENTTKYDFKSKSFQWHIEWHLLPLDLKLQAKRVPDSKTVWDALLNSSSEVVATRPEIRSYLENINVAIFMRRLDYPANVEKYHRIDPTATINEALEDKTVVEFPRFIVVLISEADEYAGKVCEMKTDNRRNFHSKKFGRGNHNGKPYQRKFESRSRQSRGHHEPDSLSFHNHTTSDTFP